MLVSFLACGKWICFHFRNVDTALFKLSDILCAELRWESHTQEIEL
jgi:hypothetical protein